MATRKPIAIAIRRREALLTRPRPPRRTIALILYTLMGRNFESKVARVSCFQQISIRSLKVRFMIDLLGIDQVKDYFEMIVQEGEERVTQPLCCYEIARQLQCVSGVAALDDGRLTLKSSCAFNGRC